MEIRAIDNTPRQNFCALRIDKGAEKILKEMPMETLQRLEKLGEEFKDYKKCDLIIDERGNFVVKPQKPVFYLNGIEKNASFNNFVDVDCVQGHRADVLYMHGYRVKYSSAVPHISGCPKTYEMCIEDKSLRGYLLDMLNNTYTNTLDKIADLVRLIENDFTPQKVKQQKMQLFANQVNTLMHKYGLNG